jgi:hypothetical protein
MNWVTSLEDDNLEYISILVRLKSGRGHCGSDRMVVGFMTTYAISAHHH